MRFAVPSAIVVIALSLLAVGCMTSPRHGSKLPAKDAKVTFGGFVMATDRFPVYAYNYNKLAQCTLPSAHGRLAW